MKTKSQHSRSVVTTAIACTLVLAAAGPIWAAPASPPEEAPGLWGSLQDLVLPLIEWLDPAAGRAGTPSPMPLADALKGDGGGGKPAPDWECTDCTKAGHEIDPDG